MRRLFWVGVGVAATVRTLGMARELTDRHVPAGARTALGAAAALTGLAHRAAAEFRAGTAEREAELRADLLAGADLARSRARVDAWRAERAERTHPAERGAAADGAPATGRPRAGSAAAAGASSGSGAPLRRGGGSHRAEDPDDGPLGYSF